MGREAKANAAIRTVAAQHEQVDGTRIRLEELDWFRLKAAHGEIFKAQAVGRQRLQELQQQLNRELQAKQDAFDALLKKLGKQYKFDPTKTTRWDDETHEVIQA